jgi:hypothetical protein
MPCKQGNMDDLKGRVIDNIYIVEITRACSVLQRIQRKKRQRKKWVRAWIQRRKKHGAHHALVKELSDEDPQGFRNFLRMDTRDFFLNNAETACSTNVLLDIVNIKLFHLPGHTFCVHNDRKIAGNEIAHDFDMPCKQGNMND